MKIGEKIFSSIREMAQKAIELAAQKTQEQYVKPKKPPVTVHRDGFQVAGKEPESPEKTPLGELCTQRIHN